MEKLEKSMALDALAAAHEHDRQLGIDPFAFEPAIVVEQPPLPPGLVIEPPDWEQERLGQPAPDGEARPQDVGAGVAAPAAEAEKLEPEPDEPDEPPTPPKRRGWRKVPA